MSSYSQPPPLEEPTSSPIILTPVHEQEETETEEEPQLECLELFEERDEELIHWTQAFQSAHALLNVAEKSMVELQIHYSKVSDECKRAELKVELLEEEVEEVKTDLFMEKNVNGILKRGIKRMRDMVMKKSPEIDAEEECLICARRLVDLKLIAQIEYTRLGCCLKPMCIQCLLKHTHTQKTSSPKCPFCRQLFC
jgi:hypothetical protein